MIAFVTLLLGLISGSYPIEVAVSGPVARVELLLDGKVVRGISAPPWRTEVPFGSSLEPHQLVARALDAKGEVLASAAQRINLPRPAAEVEIVLEADPAGKPAAARLSWQSVDNTPPEAIEVTFDGKPLVLDSQRRAALPRYDLNKVHVLAAEVEFARGVAGRREVVFGGEYGSSVSTELTAILVRAAKRSSDLSPGSLQGRFVASGQPLDVAAIERGPGNVIVLNVPGPQPLGQLWLPFGQGLQEKAAPRAEEVMGSSLAGGQRSTQAGLILGSDVGVRLLSPYARGFHGPGVASDLFPVSPDLNGLEGGLLRLLAQSGLSTLARGDGPTRIADAVAVAGLRAASENRRRAVVLILGEKETDASRYSVATVRRYLEAIRVPLYVWNPFGSRNPAAKAWAGAEDVSTLPRLHQAFGRLKADLESQRIVWVEGQYLPQAVKLAPKAGGVELVLPGAPGGAAPEPQAAR